MGPKKKTAPRNAFYFYMLDYKDESELMGRTFHGGLKDVAEAASPSWKEISSSEKKRYEEMAKAWKAEQRGDASTKYTSTGISFAEVDTKIREEEEQRMYMTNTIERDVQNLSTKTALENKLFYIIHVNYYCMTSSQTYLPAEIAISEFSIKTGVNRVYHTFVNPGPPPTGYRLTAQENIEATHQIPINFEQGDSHFSKMLRDIKNFIKVGGNSDDDLPPLYTMPDSVNYNTSISAVKSTLQMLCENEMVYGEGRNIPVFDVFLLEKLFFELRNACAQYSNDVKNSMFPTTGIPTMELEKECFSTTYDLACEYHQSIDRGTYCSLAKVKGWAFLICDFCCQDLGVKLIPGRHCPELVNTKFLNRNDDGYDRQERKRYSPPVGLCRKQSPPRRPNSKPLDDGLGLPKRENLEESAWKPSTANGSESAQPVWGLSSRPGSMSSVLSGSAPPLDFSEENFPSMGRGKTSAANRNAGGGNRLSSKMRGMRLNK